MSRRPLRKNDTENKKLLYEILVPAYWPNGEFIPIEYHQEWDKHVRELSNGFTILRSAIGEWNDGDKIIRERMIPVRFIADKEKLEMLLKYTKSFYNQSVIMAYKISDEVIFY
jgi:hypothetical protein